MDRNRLPGGGIFVCCVGGIFWWRWGRRGRGGARNVGGEKISSPEEGAAASSSHAASSSFPAVPGRVIELLSDSSEAAAGDSYPSVGKFKSRQLGREERDDRKITYPVTCRVSVVSGLDIHRPRLRKILDRRGIGRMTTNGDRRVVTVSGFFIDAAGHDNKAAKKIKFQTPWRRTPRPRVPTAMVSARSRSP